ncbi:MAG: SMI1/KNR4 family protein [Zoogloeaceae bacterium]|jgi:hypothetical protein|nr:SMI1/KNR4 family protein [Zoogloeaceae bacterium]
MNLVENYLAGLKAKFARMDNHGMLADLSLASGATQADLAALEAVYPDCPEAPIELLRRVDGTYWRKYQDKKIAVRVFGSTLHDWNGNPYVYPYYLLSTAQILESARNAGSICNKFYQDTEDILNAYDIDARIDPVAPVGLHFSDCINNGGTSWLYIDFNPQNDSKVGQIARYVHDTDSFDVIADSFEAYLEMLMEDDYAFVYDDE